MVHVRLLTRTNCPACARAAAVLDAVCGELGLAWDAIDVDDVAAGQPELRAEYGDRLPVVLLDGREHSYLDVDEPRLRADLAAAVSAER